MSFRRSRNTIKFIEYKGQDIHPSKGCITVYWWTKGDKGAEWVKAEVYGLDGELSYFGLLADSLEHLKKLVEEDVNNLA